MNRTLAQFILNPFLIIILLLSGVMSGIVTSCRMWQKPELFSESQFLLDTLVEITVVSTRENLASEAITAAYAEIQQIEELLSRYHQESRISEINQYAGEQEAVHVDDEVLKIIERSLSYTELTQRTFDITIGPIIDLWGIGTQHQQVPAPGTLQQALLLVDTRKIEIQEQRIRLSEPDMVIDLGGIAKGYAVDRALEVLQDQGIQHALVNAGGDIRCLGTKPDGTPWRIGIQHPRDNGILGVVEVQNAAIATSGDYERFFVKENVRYHHLFDPRTGMPARGCQSVTILTTTTEAADVYATAVFVMGPEAGKAFLESQAGIEGMIIRNDGEIVTTSGFSFEPIL